MSAWPILAIAAGFVLLVGGAELLVRGASGLALRLGLSSLVVGLTVVAFGTSAPELVVCLRAALVDNPDLALGNVVGSNIFNIGAILGIAALIYPITCRADLIRREVPVLIAAGAGFMVFLQLDLGEGPQTLSHLEGGLMFTSALAYTWFAYRLARQEPPEVQAEFSADVALGESAADVRLLSVGLDLGLVLVGGLLLAAGAEVLVWGAVELADYAGVSKVVIGLTIVGAGTGLPELATSIVAAWRSEPDICLGNAIGSSIYNLVLIAGATALVIPLQADPVLLQRDLWVMLALSVLLGPLMFTQNRIDRWEGGLLLAGYLGYVGYLLATI